MAKKPRCKKSLIKWFLCLLSFVSYVLLCLAHFFLYMTFFLSFVILVPLISRTLCSRWSRALGASRPTCSHTNLLTLCPAYSNFWYSVYHGAASGEFCLLNTFHHLLFHICTSTCIMLHFWALEKGKFRYQGKYTCDLDRIA